MKLTLLPDGSFFRFVLVSKRDTLTPPLKGEVENNLQVEQ